MKLGLFGGSFDPIHYGHIRPVEEAKLRLGLERVVFLPTALPPHKASREFASPHARYVMVELALLEAPDLSVSPLELTPDRPAYTVDSLRHFRRRFPRAELFLLIGGDSLAELHTWRQWREIVELAQLAVLVRPDWGRQRVHERLQPEIASLVAGERVHFVDNEPVAISATALRRLLAAGEDPPPGALPESVLKYIRKYSLYR